MLMELAVRATLLVAIPLLTVFELAAILVRFVALLVGWLVAALVGLLFGVTGFLAVSVWAVVVHMLCFFRRHSESLGAVGTVIDILRSWHGHDEATIPWFIFIGIALVMVIKSKWPDEAEEEAHGVRGNGEEARGGGEESPSGVVLVEDSHTGQGRS
jgi:hypothetical protein